MKLGEILVQLGVLTPGQVGAVLNDQARVGGRFGTRAIEKKFAQMDQISEALGRQQAMPAAFERHFDRAVPSVLGLLKAPLALRYRTIPLVLAKGNSKHVIVAMADPHDMNAIDDISFALGSQVDPMIAAEFAIAHYLKRFYRVELDLESATPPSPTRIQVAMPPSERSPAPEPVSPAPLPRLPQIAFNSPPPVQLEDALHRLAVAANRDQVVDILLDYMLPVFGCGLVFRAREDQLGVWRGYCDGLDNQALEEIHFPIAATPAFQTPFEKHTPFLGAPPSEAAEFHRELADRLGGDVPEEIVALPILVGAKVAGIIYGHGQRGEHHPPGNSRPPGDDGGNRERIPPPHPTGAYHHLRNEI